MLGSLYLRKWPVATDTQRMQSGNVSKKPAVSAQDLGAAAKANDVRRLTVFIYNGAHIDAKDHRGSSPLMLAIDSGAEEAVRLLLDVGADPNAVDHGGNSALMIAAFRGHTGLMRQLLDRGADATLKNAVGLTACDFAFTFARHEAVELLDRHAGRFEPKRSRFILFLKVMMSRLKRRGGANRFQSRS